MTETFTLTSQTLPTIRTELLCHRVMALLENDQAELLQGIVELDEAFFRESHKGLRHLKQPARIPTGTKCTGEGFPSSACECLPQ
ncbi:hypothetical protein [Parendozoicomonas sp. Alg238-R29]|uniref:hypothetical protein n=1 Tax=Parendozoicomonas sp. Alg238-R29 TaxID=2993446 RepID=UPI00248E124C|nr:hypothetical protein [Parendozoicomonas sp. Alg238-R29]